jgi:hypothetical protein
VETPAGGGQGLPAREGEPTTGGWTCWEPRLNRTEPEALRRAREVASRLQARAWSAPAEIAYVTSPYDTDFAPLAPQLLGKVEELRALWGDDGAVRWSLWLVDDRPLAEGFTRRALAAILADEGARRLHEQGRLRVIPIQRLPARRGGRKGRAILDGMGAALAALPTLRALIYINLNLKVPAALSALGLEPVLDGECDAAVGSRAAEDGGEVRGAGRLGRVKSVAFNRLTRALLPPLSRYGDTNAPLKVFAPRAATFLYEEATIPRVTMDIEWLAMLHARGWRVQTFPVIWTQRPGSRPPWHLVPQSAIDIALVRRRWGQKAGR